MLTGDLVDLVGPVFEELFGEMQDVQFDGDEEGGEETTGRGEGQAGKGRL
jgi:hypothetical protein